MGSSVSITQTPSQAGSFFARSEAALASVLVGATPSEMLIPVHCATVARISAA